MSNHLLQKIKDPYSFALQSFIGVLFICLSFSILNGAFWVWGLPALMIAVAVIVYNYRILYYGFFAILPFSVEIYLPNGLGTDLPTEPMMLAMTGISILLGIINFHKIDARFLKHPITICLFFHVAWIAYTTLFSQNPIVSFKFLLAKIWYVVPFFGLTMFIVDDTKKLKKCWSLFVVSLVASVAFVMIKYIPYGFKFKHIETIMGPFFRNHVNYAAIMAVSMPWMWALWRTADKKKSLLILASMVFILIAIYYSYTRAAMLSVIMAAGVYYIIQLRLLKPVISVSLIVAILGTIYITHDNNWLDYAPNYEKTVTHRDFNDLLSATYKMEDISTMERVYRWVAAGHMINERPLMGFGPGTFYFNYKKYTVSAFETYVSDNPQKSGIHSYYLMTWVDQGTIGLLIFMVLTVMVLLIGESTYHKLAKKEDQIFIMAAILSIIIIDAILIINDMLEVDKTGPFYFVALATIVIMDIRGEKSQL